MLFTTNSPSLFPNSYSGTHAQCLAVMLTPTYLMRCEVVYSGYPVAYLWISVWLRFALYSDGINCPSYVFSTTNISLPFDILSKAYHFPFWLFTFHEAFYRHSLNLTISYYLSPLLTWGTSEVLCLSRVYRPLHWHHVPQFGTLSQRLRSVSGCTQNLPLW